jgi:hypothetical protein
VRYPDPTVVGILKINAAKMSPAGLETAQALNYSESGRNDPLELSNRNHGTTWAQALHEPPAVGAVIRTVLADGTRLHSPLLLTSSSTCGPNVLL